MNRPIPGCPGDEQHCTICRDTLKQAEVHIAALEQRIKNLSNVADGWRRRAINIERGKDIAALEAKLRDSDTMYAKAWERELAAGGTGFIPKWHHIDCMVLSTRRLVQLAKIAETNTDGGALRALKDANDRAEKAEERAHAKDAEIERMRETQRKADAGAIEAVQLVAQQAVDARRDEREKCGDKCEKIADKYKDLPRWRRVYGVAMDCAAAIREEKDDG